MSGLLVDVSLAEPDGRPFIPRSQRPFRWKEAGRSRSARPPVFVDSELTGPLATAVPEPGEISYTNLIHHPPVLRRHELDLSFSYKSIAISGAHIFFRVTV